MNVSAKVCTLLALSFLLSATGAQATSPLPNVAVAITGIGFSYVPHLTEVECIQASCLIGETLDRAHVTMNYPSNLMYSGSQCFSKEAPTGFDFRLATARPIETRNSITFRLESTTCPNRHILLTFGAANRSDPRWIGSEVAQKINGLLVCVLTTNKSLQCNDKPLITEAEERRIFAAATSWAGRASKPARP